MSSEHTHALEVFVLWVCLALTLSECLSTEVTEKPVCENVVDAPAESPSWEQIPAAHNRKESLVHSVDGGGVVTASEINQCLS